MKKTAIMLCAMLLVLTACGDVKQISQRAQDNSANVKQNDSEKTKNEDTGKKEERKTTLDDYVGYYTNNGDEVTIEKKGDKYTVEGSFYRLTGFENGEATLKKMG